MRNILILLLLVCTGVYAQDVQNIDADTAKVAKSGYNRISIKTGKLFFRGLTGTKKEVVSTNNSYVNPSWIPSLALAKITGLQDSLSNTVKKIAGKSLSANDYTTAEKTKLAGVATGATANSADATLLARVNHTGTQTSSTISDFNTAADARVVAGITGKANLAGNNTFTGAATFTGGIISNGGGGLSSNTAIGQGTLASNTTGVTNTAIGTNSLNANTTGNYNTAVGDRSLLKNTTGSLNVASGGSSLYENTTGSYNTANGINALNANTTANSNSAFGNDALTLNTTGSSNTANGRASLYYNTTGSNNVSFGFQSLLNNTTGSFNTALGNDAGRFTSGGSVANTITNNSVYLGSLTKPLADNQTNQIVIGTNAVGNGSNTTVLGNTSTTQTQIFGNTILSNTSQATDTGEKLQVNGTSKFSGNSLFTGTIQVSSTTGLNVDYANRFNSIVFSRQGIPTNYTNVISNSWSGTTTDQTMNFEIGNGLTSRVTALTLVGNGNVGIGTTAPTSKLHISSGNIEADNSANGLILKSPDGTRYLIKVANGGTLTVTAL